MANTIKIRRSAVASAVPTTGQLALGELALNTFDGKLFIKKDNGTASIVEIGGGGGGGATNLSYTAATRIVASDTGTDATLPLVTSGDAGLAPASGGGTTNFLRADGTWAAPSGGGGSSSAGSNLFLSANFF